MKILYKMNARFWNSILIENPLSICDFRRKLSPFSFRIVHLNLRTQKQQAHTKAIIHFDTSARDDASCILVSRFISRTRIEIVIFALVSKITISKRRAESPSLRTPSLRAQNEYFTHEVWKQNISLWISETEDLVQMRDRPRRSAAGHPQARALPSPTHGAEPRYQGVISSDKVAAAALSLLMRYTN